MEKILLPIDVINPSPNALDFACYLGRLSKSRVTGIVLKNPAGEENPAVEQGKEGSYRNGATDNKTETYKKTNRQTETCISLFQDACEKRSVRYMVHKEFGVPASKVITESRYADLIVMDARTSFDTKFEGVPTEFVKDVLKDSECPVVIAPENFEGIDEIVFTFNGSKSSVFAIKQFCYLFPDLDDKKITVVEVDEGGLCSAEEKGKFKEWISGHYSSIGYTVIKGETESELFSYLLKKKNIFIVMGSYGRSAVSRFFKHSRVDLLLKASTQALFITHY